MKSDAIKNVLSEMGGRIPNAEVQCMALGLEKPEDKAIFLGMMSYYWERAHAMPLVMMLGIGIIADADFHRSRLVKDERSDGSVRLEYLLQKRSAKGLLAHHRLCNAAEKVFRTVSLVSASLTADIVQGRIKEDAAYDMLHRASSNPFKYQDRLSTDEAREGMQQWREQIMGAIKGSEDDTSQPAQPAQPDRSTLEAEA